MISRTIKFSVLYQTQTLALAYLHLDYSGNHKNVFSWELQVGSISSHPLLTMSGLTDIVQPRSNSNKTCRHYLKSLQYLLMRLPCNESNSMSITSYKTWDKTATFHEWFFQIMDRIPNWLAPKQNVWIRIQSELFYLSVIHHHRFIVPRSPPHILISHDAFKAGL